MVLRLFIVSRFRPFATSLLVLFAAFAPQHLSSQQWTPAGQMIGPLMWEFPLSLPDGTHLIPLGWVNARRNDSLYWFDIKSFMTTPKMYERQTLDFKQISDINDFDSDGRMDLWGGNYGNGGLTIFGVFTETERRRPHQTGIVYASSEVSTRYFGDIDGDGLNDDLSAEGENSARVVYGDRNNPFIGPSYVELFDNSREIYPDLPPTKVAAVGMLSGIACIVQSYQVLPETPPYYELHELNMDDLRARAPKIRTRLVQKVNVGENRRYGNVVLRSADVWWLFSSYGTDSSPNGIKITPTSMSLEPVSDFWRGDYQQYYGQGGHKGDDNFPRVMDGDRPFIREDFEKVSLEGAGSVRHSVSVFARLTDPATAAVEVIGRAYPDSTFLWNSYIGGTAVVPDIDGDSINDLMMYLWADTNSRGDQKTCVSLYLTSQRPTVTVKVDATDSTKHIIDQGESWRIVDGVSCSDELAQSAKIYDISGAVAATVTQFVNGADIIIEKPKDLSHQALWLRLGSCTLRLP